MRLLEAGGVAAHVLAFAFLGFGGFVVVSLTLAQGEWAVGATNRDWVFEAVRRTLPFLAATGIYWCLALASIRLIASEQAGAPSSRIINLAALFSIASIVCGAIVCFIRKPYM